VSATLINSLWKGVHTKVHPWIPAKRKQNHQLVQNGIRGDSWFYIHQGPEAGKFWEFYFPNWAIAWVVAITWLISARFISPRVLAMLLIRRVVRRGVAKKRVIHPQSAWPHCYPVCPFFPQTLDHQKFTVFAAHTFTAISSSYNYWNAIECVLNSGDKNLSFLLLSLLPYSLFEKERALCAHSKAQK